MSRELDRLLGPEGPEISCEECFERLDEYVDAELAGRDPEQDVPGMAAHLAGCPACPARPRRRRGLTPRGLSARGRC
jgi:hypothetical protein